MEAAVRQLMRALLFFCQVLKEQDNQPHWIKVLKEQDNQAHWIKLSQVWIQLCNSSILTLQLRKII